jgi:2-oxoglutarate ferredoxin oxidoreductase subunit delta
MRLPAAPPAGGGPPSRSKAQPDARPTEQRAGDGVEGEEVIVVSKTKPRIAVIVDEEICKGCGLCIALCPHHVMGFAGHINSRGFHPACAVRPDQCTACAQCAIMCPDVCIRILKSD